MKGVTLPLVHFLTMEGVGFAVQLELRRFSPRAPACHTGFPTASPVGDLPARVPRADGLTGGAN
jgi:hypothetical protein